MAEQSITFANPPVVETVLGVQFDLLPGFSNAHLGAFWKWLRDRDRESQWVHVTDAPPIGLRFEHFAEPRNWAEELAATLKMSQPSAARLQIRSADGNAMVQVQNGRFHYNWIGRDTQEYPRYTVVRPRFDQLRKEFVAFLAAEGLAAMVPNQWEITYVNRIPQGTAWRTKADLPGLFRGLPGPWMSRAPVHFDGCDGVWQFEIAPQRGRLHVDLRHKRTEEGEIAFIRLTLTARGPARDDAELAAGLDLGRQAIVSTFAAIHSDAALEYWGIQR